MIRARDECVCEVPAVYERMDLSYACERCGGSVRRLRLTGSSARATVGLPVPASPALGLVSPTVGCCLALAVGFAMGYCYAR